MSLVKKYLLTISWLALILFLTLSPGSSIPSVSIIGIDKLVHLFLFLVLSILFTIELRKANTGKSVRIATPAIVCFIIGVLIECIQIYIPDRTFSIWDILANTSGVFLGIGIMTVLFKKPA